MRVELPPISESNINRGADSVPEPESMQIDGKKVDSSLENSATDTAYEARKALRDKAAAKIVGFNLAGEGANKFVNDVFEGVSDEQLEERELNRTWKSAARLLAEHQQIEEDRKLAVKLALGRSIEEKHIKKEDWEEAQKSQKELWELAKEEENVPVGSNTQEETYQTQQAEQLYIDPTDRPKWEREWGQKLSEQWNEWDNEQKQRWKELEQEELDAQSDQVRLEARWKQLNGWEEERLKLHKQLKGENKPLQERLKLFEQWEMERRKQAAEQTELDSIVLEWKGWTDATPPLPIAEEESTQSNTSPDLSIYDNDPVMSGLLERLQAIKKGEVPGKDKHLNECEAYTASREHTLFTSENNQIKVEA